MMPDITAKLGGPTTATDLLNEPEVADLEPAPGQAERLIEAELLVEDVSIDGMCGVY
jgi:mycofactocin precursor